MSPAFWMAAIICAVAAYIGFHAFGFYAVLGTAILIGIVGWVDIGMKHAD